MKTPKYTQADLDRQPKGGYRKAAETDVTLTFKRARQRQAENAQEVAAKVAPMPLRKAKP